MKSSYFFAKRIADRLYSERMFDTVYLGVDLNADSKTGLVDIDDSDMASDIVVVPLSVVEDSNFMTIMVYLQYTVICDEISKSSDGRYIEYLGLNKLSVIEDNILTLKYFDPEYKGEIVENEILPLEQFPSFSGYSIIEYRKPISIKGTLA